MDTVAVADANLTLSPKLKSLGVILDSRLRLSFDAHVAMVCKTCNYHIWALRHIRRLEVLRQCAIQINSTFTFTLLPLDVARTIACSIIGATLDYGVPISSIPAEAPASPKLTGSRCATTAENVTLVHSLNHFIGCRSLKESSLKLQFCLRALLPVFIH